MIEGTWRKPFYPEDLWKKKCIWRMFIKIITLGDKKPFTKSLYWITFHSLSVDTISTNPQILIIQKLTNKHLKLFYHKIIRIERLWGDEQEHFSPLKDELWVKKEEKRNFFLFFFIRIHNFPSTSTYIISQLTRFLWLYLPLVFFVFRWFSLHFLWLGTSIKSWT